MTTTQEFRTQISLATNVERIADALERIAKVLENDVHINIDHAHIDDIGEIHGDVVTHPKQF